MLFSYISVGVIDTLAMVAVVLPIGSATVTAIVYLVAAGIDIGSSVEFIVPVDIDIHIVATPTPTAATPDRSPDGNSGAESHEPIPRSRRVIPAWIKPVWVAPSGAINNSWRIGRHIDHLGRSGFDYDDLVFLLCDRLLFGRLQVTFVIS